MLNILIFIKTTLLLILFCWPMLGFGQNVYIPDANFKNYLVNNTAINTNGDSEIQVSEASAFTGAINCYYESISDFTGIEAFTALTELDCGGNLLTSLDVSSNTALEVVSCNYNELECLNVKNGNNSNLTALVADNNPILIQQK